jgi:hypothetical protein
MKLALKLGTALAILGFAVPALPCEGMMKTATKKEAKPAVAATEKKAEKKAAPKAQVAETKPAQAAAAN